MTGAQPHPTSPTLQHRRVSLDAELAATASASAQRPAAAAADDGAPAALPAQVARLKRPLHHRIGSAISSAWGSDSSLLRHSSITNVEPSGRWHQACFMLVCADGAPFLLGLPAALARLGWAGGLAVLLAGFLCILHAATRVVMLHEHGGHRRKSLRELAQSVYGKERGGWITLPFLCTVNFGTCVMYQVIAGQALQSLCHALSGSGGGCLRLTWWILIFSASQLLLCLLPDINSLGAVTALGAATTLGFSVLATVGAALHGVPPSTSYGVPGSAADRAFGAFSSLGGVFLLYGFTALLEVQSTLAPAPTSAVPPMVTATCAGYSALAALFAAVAISGYAAFGAAVQPIVLQSMAGPTWLVAAGYLCMVLNAVPGYLVFAHSLFDHAELRIMLAHWTGLEFRGGPALLAKRYGFRWAFVGATAALAVCLPFMGELMGLVGALGYVPLCFLLPCLMWLRVQRGQLSAAQVALNWAVIALAAAVMVLAAVGSIRTLIVNASTFHFFA